MPKNTLITSKTPYHGLVPTSPEKTNQQHLGTLSLGWESKALPKGDAGLQPYEACRNGTRERRVLGENPSNTRCNMLSY
ncbi:hypothetical protein L484_025419 [Morus notabilis]|uniref:Uncharacterized protein n=1 Tax=Morus notabilis TaxID=981085 RepID=W9RQU7_9ROSA|nr:hypothetical protein L484_025419 [Morus notabilis]